VHVLSTLCGWRVHIVSIVGVPAAPVAAVVSPAVVSPTAISPTTVTSYSDGLNVLTTAAAVGLDGCPGVVLGVFTD
jgi:hypothetical protein